MLKTDRGGQDTGEKKQGNQLGSVLVSLVSKVGWAIAPSYLFKY